MNKRRKRRLRKDHSGSAILHPAGSRCNSVYACSSYY